MGRIEVQGEEYNLNCAERNSRGQYSDAVLNELESQNDGQVEGIMGKVRQLKDVSLYHEHRLYTHISRYGNI